MQVGIINHTTWFPNSHFQYFYLSVVGTRSMMKIDQNTAAIERNDLGLINGYIIFCGVWKRNLNYLHLAR